MIDHYAAAVESEHLAMTTDGIDSRKWLRKAQVHAILTLAEQQRIANLIALGAFDGDDGAYNRQIVGQYPDVARALRIEAP